MAKVSDGYTIGAVSQCIRDVITCKRMLQLRVKPLTHVELINALSTKEPVYREEEEAFLSWWAKVRGFSKIKKYFFYQTDMLFYG